MTQDGKIKNELKLYFRTGRSADRRERMRDSIFEYLFSDPTKATYRIIEFAGWLRCNCAQPEALRLEADQLIRHMSVRLIEQNNFRPYLDFYVECRVRGLTVELFRQARPSHENLASRGMMWFGNTFMRTVGETLEASMAFALFLLGCIAPIVRLARLTRSAEDLAAHAAELNQTGDTRWILGAIYALQESAQCPAGPAFASKRWLERLVSEAPTDPRVSEVLESVTMAFHFLRQDGGSSNGQFRIIFQSEEEARRLTETIHSNDQTIDFYEPIITLPDSCRHTMTLWAEKVRETRQQGTMKSVDMINAFLARRDAVKGFVLSRISEMLASPRRGFRPDGQDHVEISVTPLHLIGCRSLAFHSAGRHFPDVGIDLLVRKETPHLFALPVSVDITDSLERFVETAEHALSNPSFPAKALTAMLLAVTTDAMHRIIVANKPLRQRAKRADSRATVEAAHERLGVRPHIRRLPKEQHASQEALARCQSQFGWTLPDGLTFVDAYYRNGSIEHSYISRPFASYVDDDVYDLIKEMAK